jgi:hypothetical protein
VHGEPNANNRRGIAMDGTYVAVIDSYISDFQELGTDSQGLWAYNTTGPLKIVNNYIEAASENVLFGGGDSKATSLVPADIEIRNNHFFKPLSLIGTKLAPKNLLEFKAAQRVLVTGNTFQNSPAGAQNGFAILITPRNQSGKAPWSTTTDIAINGNTLINVGGGFNILGQDNYKPSLPTARILIRDNVIGVTGLGGSDGRTFQIVGTGGSDYTIDHNTIINTALPPLTRNSDVMMVSTNGAKVTNLTFTNNLSTLTSYGIYGSPGGEGTAALNGHFDNWVFTKNVFVGARSAIYPAGNHFPSDVAQVRFVSFANSNYALAADSPYKSAGTDGKDIGANVSVAPSTSALMPNSPSNGVVK